jgi:ATP-dependent DNA helicase RecG
MLPCPGIGSGIKRALDDWPDIRFTDDRDGCLFTVTVHRKEAKKTGESSLKSSPKTDEKILEILSRKKHTTIPEVAFSLGITAKADVRGGT